MLFVRKEIAVGSALEGRSAGRLWESDGLEITMLVGGVVGETVLTRVVTEVESPPSQA